MGIYSGTTIHPIEDKVSVEALTIGNLLMDDLTDGRETWKYPTKAYKTTDINLAYEIAEVLGFYLGGFELDSDGESYSVSSLGYYHYVGA